MTLPCILGCDFSGVVVKAGAKTKFSSGYFLVCVFIHMCVNMCVCACVMCICAYTHIYVCTFVFVMCICACTHIYVCTCVCTSYARVSVHENALHTNNCLLIYIYVYIYTHLQNMQIYVLSQSEF